MELNGKLRNFVGSLGIFSNQIMPFLPKEPLISCEDLLVSVKIESVEFGWLLGMFDYQTIPFIPKEPFISVVN